MTLNRDTLIYAAGKILPAVSVLGLMWAGLHYMGSADYGKYILLANLSATITAFTSGWIQQSIIRYSGMAPEMPESIGRTPFQKLLLLSSTSAAMITGLVSVVYLQESLTVSLAVSVYSFIFNTYSIQLSLLQSGMKAKRFAVTESLAAAGGILIVLSVFLVLPSPGFLYMLGGTALGYFTSLLFNTGITNQLPEKDEILLLFKRYISFGGPLTVWLFLSSLFNVADRFMIEHYFTYREVGQYSAIYDLIYKISAFLSVPVLLTYHPRIAGDWNRCDFRSAGRHIRAAVFLEIILMLLMFFGFLLIGSTILPLLLNDVWNETSTWHYQLIFSSMIWQISMFLHKKLEMMMKLHIMLGGILLSLGLNLTLNSMLLPVYGYQFAATSTLICTLFYALWIIVFDLKTRYAQA
jgi:O-antigen/teichoic acid export membrane protein